MGTLVSFSLAALAFSQASLAFAAATVSPTSLNWNFVAVGGRGGQKTVTLTNAETNSITISSIALAGANPGDFKIYSKTCGSTLAASASCTVNIVFAPTTTGNRSATLVFTDSASNSPQSVALTGLGVVANSVSPNPSSLTFASTAVGSTSGSQSVLVANATSSSVSFSSISISGTNAGDFSISRNSCTTVVAGGSCSTSVVFKPIASGTRTALLVFTDTASNSPQTVALSGTGSGGSTGSVSASPSSLTFASTTVGSTSASQSATLSNTTSSGITISSVAISGANASDFSVATNSCASTLAAAGQCTASIVFTPSASGTRSAVLQFTDSASNSPQSVALTGTGATASGGTASVSPTSLNWNFVAVGGRGGQKVVTLSNTGSSSFNISSIGITGANPGDFLIYSKTCGSSLAASASCTANIVFAPTTTGNRSAQLQFTDSATNSPQTVALTGLGVTPSSVSPNPSSLVFATTNVGSSSSSQSVMLANATSSSVSIGSVAISGTNPGDFVIASTSCGATLVAGGSCLTSVFFKPTAGGTRSATLLFTDTATNSPQSVALTGSAPGSTFTISPQNPTVQVNGTLQFTATAPSTWAASCGSISSGGLYTAPATAQTCTVTATASDGSGTTASTNVTVAASSVTITPSAVALHALNTQSFNASQPVSWSASCGSITSAGVYTAPATSGSCTITATASSGTPFTATATANIDIVNYTARKGGGGNLGLQSDELALSPSTVNANTFGLKWSTPVDAWVNAQPLYMNALPINGTPHNVVFVVTANDSVYAFDGDTGAQLWQVSLIPAGATAVSGSTVGFSSAPLIGILSTPVIDPTTNTMYVVAETSEQNATYFPHRLHALDVTTGAEKFGGPVLISDPQMAPMHKLQRPGLTLANGNVYVAIGSMQDMQPYHGFLFAFNAQTLAQEAVWNVTPTGSEGGIWMGAEPPSVDSSGNIYVTTGNGTIDGTANFGESAVKLSPTLQVLDYFTPYDYATLNGADLDLGSGTVMVLPDQNGSHPHELIVCGKPTPIYVLDRDNLGQLGTSSDNVIQRLDNEVGAPKPNSTAGVQACFTGPAMWGNNIYFGGKYDYLKMFALDPNTGLLSSTPVSQGTLAYGYPGTDPMISSNGSTNGIVWTIDTATSALIALDATDLTKTLFTGQLSGGAIRWTAPTPVNGHVYVGEEGVVFGFGLK